MEEGQVSACMCMWVCCAARADLEGGRYLLHPLHGLMDSKEPGDGGGQLRNRPERCPRREEALGQKLKQKYATAAALPVALAEAEAAADDEEEAAVVLC